MGVFKMLKKGEFLSFDQTLGMVEDFMTKSGIRNYCTYYCKGKCCYGCYSSKNSCHITTGRRMGCSKFICGSIHGAMGKDIQEHYYNNVSVPIGHARKCTDLTFYAGAPSRNYEKAKKGFKVHRDSISFPDAYKVRLAIKSMLINNIIDEFNKSVLPAIEEEKYCDVVRSSKSSCKDVLTYKDLIRCRRNKISAVRGLNKKTLKFGINVLDMLEHKEELLLFLHENTIL